jgi:hypothetical protein
LQEASDDSESEEEDEKEEEWQVDIGDDDV